jgi:hypothetical protein
MANATRCIHHLIMHIVSCTPGQVVRMEGTKGLRPQTLDGITPIKRSFVCHRHTRGRKLSFCAQARRTGSEKGGQHCGRPLSSSAGWQQLVQQNRQLHWPVASSKAAGQSGVTGYLFFTVGAANTNFFFR